MANQGKSNQLTAENRTETKGAALRQLRLSGRVPAVVYGSELDGTPVSVDAKDFSKILRTGRTEMFDLELSGKKIPVLIKDYQEQDGRFLHADFLKISKNKPIRVKVAIDFQGTAAGTKTGGILQVQETELEIEALPADLPSAIEVDISGLDVGDKLSVGDIKLPDKVTLIADEAGVIASVVVPRIAETEEEAPEPEASAEGTGAEAKQAEE